MKPGDVRELGAKAGITRALEAAQPVRLQLCARQMRCTEPTEMPIALAIARPVQWVAWCGGSVQVNAITRAVGSAASGALPGLRVLSRSKPLDSALGEALLPALYRGRL